MNRISVIVVLVPWKRATSRVSQGRLAIPSGALALLALITGCSAQPETVDAPHAAQITRGQLRLLTTVDRVSARIAEPIQLTLSLTAPKQVDVVWPEDLKGLGSFAVFDVEHDVQSESPATHNWVYRCRLECYTAGQQTIPALPIGLKGWSGDRSGVERTRSGQQSILASTPVTVTIQSVVGETASPGEVYGIEEIVSLSGDWNDWTPGIAAVLAALGLVLASGWYIWQVRRAGPATLAQLALEAIDRLETLEHQDSWQAAQTLETLLQIVTRYLEHRFSMSHKQRTTPELLALVDETPRFGVAARATLIRLLRTGEDVKFARREVTSDVSHHAFGLARQLVDQVSGEGAASPAAMVHETADAAGRESGS